MYIKAFSLKNKMLKEGKLLKILLKGNCQQVWTFLIEKVDGVLKEMILVFSFQNNIHIDYSPTKLMLNYLTEIRIQAVNGHKVFLENLLWQYSNNTFHL